MEICNLMIGDWVSYNDKMSCKITALCKDRPVFDTLLGYQDWSIPYEKLKPIPLTDEILKKNGFDYENNVGDVLEYYNYEIIYNTWEHELRILENREQILKIKTFDEMCVHELQHALRLCGINKEIKI